MRLLERNGAGEICLTKLFVNNVPPYAILLHTWGTDEEEVSFQDLIDGTGKNKLGYDKIRFCGDQAWHDGLQFFWVDTCCIKKSDNTELQEAINSMFRWYRDAAKCYVYLASVSGPTLSADGKSNWELAFRSSRWFTRGWTLQELIAPSSVEFFSPEGVRLGDKRSLEQQKHDTTGISVRALRGDPLSVFGVAERMAGTEKRNHTQGRQGILAPGHFRHPHAAHLRRRGEERIAANMPTMWGRTNNASGTVPNFDHVKTPFRSVGHERPRCAPLGG